MATNFPNRNYLAAYTKNLIKAGDILADKIISCTGPMDPAREALKVWLAAKEGISGLAKE